MFVLGTTSLVVLGLALPMTTSFARPAGDAGHLVSAFALTYAALALPLQWVFAGRLSRRAAIITGLGLLGAGSVGGALAQSFPFLIAMRVIGAAGGALVGPTAAAAGAALVAPHQRGRAFAAVFAGFTLSTVVGVPIATWLGLLVGWRGAMATVGVAALISLVAVAIALRDGSAEQTLRPTALLTILADRFVGFGVLTTLLHLAAQFVIYALMNAMLVEYYHVQPIAMPTALLLFGVGGVAGNVIAGLIADRFGARPTIFLSFFGLATIFVVLMLPISPLTAVAMMAGCAMAGTLFTAPQQVRLTAFAPEEGRGAILALNGSASYLGLAAGSSVASLTFERAGFAGVPPAALGVLLVAAGIFVMTVTRENKLRSET